MFGWQMFDADASGKVPFVPKDLKSEIRTRIDGVGYTI
jgi:hypothetical protein